MKQHTYTGKEIDLLNMGPHDVEIADIAHALSLQTRFAGHCMFHYSVASHSMLVATLVEEAGATPPRVLKALMHDASEAYIVDIPRPLKLTTALESYLSIEARIQRTIEKHFEIPLGTDLLVSQMDDIALAWECEQLFLPGFVYEGAPSHAAYMLPSLYPREPRHVEQTFMSTFFRCLTRAKEHASHA